MILIYSLFLSNVLAFEASGFGTITEHKEKKRPVIDQTSVFGVFRSGTHYASEAYIKVKDFSYTKGNGIKTLVGIASCDGKIYNLLLDDKQRDRLFFTHDKDISKKLKGNELCENSSNVTYHYVFNKSFWSRQ